MRITMVNAHSSHNLGDAAIVKTSNQLLRETYPGSHITVVSDTPDLDRGKLGADQYLGLDTPFVRVPAPIRKRLFTGYLLYVDLLGASAVRRLTSIWFRRNRAIYDAMRRSDLVISCGGGYISSLGKLEIRLALMHFASQVGRRTLFWPQSVSDLSSRWHRYLVRRVVSESDAFVAREDLTYRSLTELGVPRKLLHLAADSAFLLPFERAWHSTVPLGEKKRFGLTVTRWSFPGRTATAHLWDRYKAAICRMVQAVIADGYTVYVFPQVTGPGIYSDDRTTATEVFARCEGPRVHVLNGAYEPEQLKSMIALMDIFVGTRMHSNIFALGAGVPTAAIAYQDKTSGIMQGLGFADLVIDIADIGDDALLALYRRLSDRQAAVRRDLESLIPRVQQSARTAADVCLSIVPARVPKEAGRQPD